MKLLENINDMVVFLFPKQFHKHTHTPSYSFPSPRAEPIVHYKHIRLI